MDRPAQERDRECYAAVVGVAGVVSCAGYWLLTFRLRADGSAGDLWSFLGLMTALFAVYFGMAAWTHRRAALGTGAILAFALVFRLLLLPAGLPPIPGWTISRDDVTSAAWPIVASCSTTTTSGATLWDGHVFASGFDPYLHAPAELEALADDDDPGAAACSKRSCGRTSSTASATRATAPSTRRSPSGCFALSMPARRAASSSGRRSSRASTSAPACCCWLCCAARPAVGRPALRLEPLVLKELAGSGHLDAVMIFFLVLAVTG